MIRFPQLQAGLLAGTVLLAATGARAQQDIPIPATPEIVQQSDVTVRTTILPGTEPMPIMPGAVREGPRRGDISLNFPSADVRAVAQAVLGDLLGENYTIAEGIGGTVSLVTAQPVARSALLGLFEEALARSGMALVPAFGGYEIQRASGARAPIAPGAMGFGSEVISLRFINAEEVRKVLDAAIPGVAISTDPGSNSIVIAGTTGQRSSARDLLGQFDVDWLRNTSFALYVPQRTDARLIVPSLDRLINDPASPTRGLVRLIAMVQLNGILAISAQAQYLTDVQRWVEILDREGENSEARIFVYRVQNGRARDLARTINAAFGSSSAEIDQETPGGAPVSGNNGNSQTITTSQTGFSGQSDPSANRQAAQDGGNPAQSSRITADEVNNAVIVFGTPREYATIESALRQLDVPPVQVMIEAAITEVGLNDTLRYGVQWNFASGDSTAGYSEGSNGGANRIFPGFSYFYGGSSISATLNALEQQTNIRVVSAPKLMVLNNQTAALQVGDQVPISTGSATNLNSGGDSVVSTIEYRDTGVILRITPRVNASGLVQLDVSQEVSDISTNSPVAQTQEQSPTISTRRISTTVAVRDGEVIALGGLFRDSQSTGRNGIPILSQIPVIGALFGTHRNVETRTELIVLLKPHVIRTDEDGRAVTEELRQRLRTLEPFRSTGQIP